MDVQAFLDTLKADPAYAGQIVHVHREPAREPVWAPPPEALCTQARAFLQAQGISRLYQHQAEAIEAALAGEDVLLTTPAASGKSLCYQFPLLQALLEDPQATALLIFPAKALARDQVAAWDRGLGAVAKTADVSTLAAHAFDADVSSSGRLKARDEARVLLTNPEMLHVNILPGNARWNRFLANLRIVVLDEIHTYAGFFGANMANVVRRLQRLCRHYGSRPRFLCASATLGNPAELAATIVGRPVHHVRQNTGASGTRTYAFWNPPKIKKREWRGRRSANVEAHELMIRLIQQRTATICFSKARNTAEMIYRYVRDGFREQAPALADKVIPYRGGYKPAQRREMERRLRDGELLGVSATRALELGIDVGVLDACIIVGYPGTLNAFFQQAGRVGRAGRDSVCFLIGTGTAINQYVMGHPHLVFEKPIEQAVVDRDNPFVVLGHLRCAIAELPVASSDLPLFGYAAELALEVLEEQRKVHRVRNKWYHASSGSPSHELRLRGYGDESTVIHDADTGEVLDRMDKFRSMRLFYPGAIYFHMGDIYEMVEHDTERNVVTVRRTDVSYYTDPITGTSVDHVDLVLEQRPLGRGTACLGEVFAVLSTPVYERVAFYTLDRISLHEIDFPHISYDAMSFWLEVPDELAREIACAGLNPEDGLKGILYCVSRILPLFLTSDTNDFDWTLGCRNSSPTTMFWFEFYLRGIGHAEQCYERLEEILRIALDHLLTCDCDDGCPNCTSRLITPYHVRNVELGEGLVHSRRAAAAILNSILSGEPVRDSLELLDRPRPRGQEYLPTVTLDRRQTAPHRIPTDERLRTLLIRKLERDRLPKLPVDHPIDLTPPRGMPAQAAAGLLPKADAEKRAGHGAIRRRAGGLSKRIEQRLTERRRAADTKAPEEKHDGPLRTPAPQQALKMGDRIAARARKRKKT